jgi:hypothetical protein
VPMGSGATEPPPIPFVKIVVETLSGHHQF